MSHLKRYGDWALVTGASSGIGREFARALAANGIHCVLVARREDRLRELAGELASRHGVQTLVAPADLAAPGAVEKVYAAAEGIDVGILVNNAGFGYAGRFHTLDPARLEEMVRVNCLAPVLLTRAFLPDMQRRRRGALILVSSVLGLVPGPLDAVYSASKAFDLLFGESLWAELRGSGIDVLTLCPNLTHTEFLDVQRVPEAEASFLNRYADRPDRLAVLALRRLGRRPLALPWRTLACTIPARAVPRRLVALLALPAMRHTVARGKS